MLVRNAYTGALHEVPDQQLYEVGEPVFDGFGNPVGGIFDDIVNTVKNVVTAPVRAATSMMSPIGSILGNIIPGMGGGGQQAAAPAPPSPGMIPWNPAMAQMQPHPYVRHPFPLGWQHAPLPYTGLGPKRLYMRCAVWPGPSGLVPGYAANMTAQQQQALGPGGGGGYGRRHGGHHRRRR